MTVRGVVSSVIRSPIQSVLGTGSGGGGSYDYYVDSVGGSDSNAGTQAAPFQTLAKLQSIITAGKRASLVRGSYWREQFNVPASNIVIGVTGVGVMPVLDGADVVTTGWTQPDAGTYPNVWSRSWSRSSPTTTGSEVLGYWQAGVRTTYKTSLANLQAGSNGDWHTTSLTAQNSTVSIRSAADPNSDGILREITKRHYGISSHSSVNLAAPANTTVTGPIEMKRCVGHYNALPQGSGVASRLFLRDGNIHHATSESALLFDQIGTEYSPEIAPSVFVNFRPSGVGFIPINRRLLALMPGGASRLTGSNSAFYAHSSTPLEVDNYTLEGCISRGLNYANADAKLLAITGGYCEDAYGNIVVCTATSTTINEFLVNDTTASANGTGTAVINRGLSASTFTAQHLASYTRKGASVRNVTGGTKPVVTNCSIANAANTAITGGELALTYSVIAPTARTMDQLTTGYTGNFNVFAFMGQPNPQFFYNGVVYGTLSAFQTASGQDAQSVFLKAADQVSGNGIAFWLGVSSGANAGPSDGDFRINPNARVYNGAGATLSGVFADGTTPVTSAGPQTHWDYNLRASVAGPPSRFPTLPTTIAEMRTYLENPTGWNFYP